MQQDTITLYIFKLWSAVEANKNRVIGAAVAVVVIVLLGFFLSWQRDQKEINAGQAFSQVVVSAQPNTPPAQIADQYLKIVSDFPGTQAGQRAQLQGATSLFAAGKYPEAQAQFQKFVDSYPGSTLISTAVLGLAAAQAAQGKLDGAVTTYRSVIDTYSSAATVLFAKFALAGIYEQQGKTADALKYYDEIARVQGSTLAQQAALKAVEIKASMPAPAAPAAAVATPAPTAPAAMKLTTPAK